MQNDMIYILDSTVFLENYSMQFRDYACVTVYEVLDEVKDPKAKIQLDMSVSEGLALIEPDDKYIQDVKKTVDKTKDKLSVTDIKIIALALKFRAKDKRCMIVSDDYGVQNVAKMLGLDFLPVSQDGIKKGLLWYRKCTACGRKTDDAVCGFCGSATKFFSRKG